MCIRDRFYGAPFTSIAKYDDFKLAADTKSHTFENRFQRIDPDHLTYVDGVYTIGEGAGQMPFRNPDFRFNEFRSNLVARWEYLPGSTLEPNIVKYQSDYQILISEIVW